MLPLIGGLISTIGKGLLEKVADGACSVVDQMVTDKDLAVRLKSELANKVLDIDITEFLEQIRAQKEIVVAEAQGESWLQRNWRPLTMLVFASIIANEYMFYPYISALFNITVNVRPLPENMWNCLTLGLSGYVVGRSAEKIAGGTGLKSIASKLMNGAGKNQ